MDFSETHFISLATPAVREIFSVCFPARATQARFRFVQALKVVHLNQNIVHAWVVLPSMQHIETQISAAAFWSSILIVYLLICYVQHWHRYNFGFEAEIQWIRAPKEIIRSNIKKLSLGATTNEMHNTKQHFINCVAVSLCYIEGQGTAACTDGVVNRVIANNILFFPHSPFG